MDLMHTDEGIDVWVVIAPDGPAGVYTSVERAVEYIRDWVLEYEVIIPREDIEKAKPIKINDWKWTFTVADENYQIIKNQLRW